LHHILSNFVIVTAATVVLFFTTPITAQQVPQPVINGVLHPRESNFFREGREKLEKEIQLLLKRSIFPPEDPLKVNQIQKIEQPPLENPQVLPMLKEEHYK
jgi:hypothetical protein